MALNRDATVAATSIPLENLDLLEEGGMVSARWVFHHTSARHMGKQNEKGENDVFIMEEE